MKGIVVFLTAMILIGTSQASMTPMPASGNANSGKVTTTVSSAKTVTQKGQVLVKSRIPKPKLFRANPHRLSHFALIDDNDDIGISDDDLATSYRRRDLQKIQNADDDPDELSEHIRWRLFLARTAAMIKYNEIHS